MSNYDPKWLEAYRFHRQAFPANVAMEMASREIVLRGLVDSGTYRVRWEHDDDFELDWDWPESELSKVRKKLNDGNLEVLGMILERQHVCSECGNADWEHVDSLWGIVLAPDETYEDEKRSYEAQLEITNI